VRPVYSSHSTIFFWIGVATVTGGGGNGGGACVDGLQPADKRQTATAIQQAGGNNLLKDLVNVTERQPDSILSEKNELAAARAACAVTAIGIIVIGLRLNVGRDLLSERLGALEGQAAVVASKENVHQSRIRWQ
jgi:hypothetical protein